MSVNTLAPHLAAMRDDDASFARDSSVNAPLVVDLDGTLVSTDTLIENILLLIKKSPLDCLRLPFWFMKGRAVLKEMVAGRARISAESLPYNVDFLAFLRSEKVRGRRIILATAAHASIAADVAAHLDLFEGVLASETGHNLKGASKLAAIRNYLDQPFVYAGDSHVDLPIWNAAQAAILVGVSPGLALSVRKNGVVEREFPRQVRALSTWGKALRVHQWLKNLLLFVPVLTAFSQIDGGKIVTMALVFLSFSFAASATYVINDLWDLESDRAHPRKRLRPFAAGRIPVLNGVAVAAAMLVLAFVLAFITGPAFCLMLALYIVVTSAYSWIFKGYVLIDVITLSMLYTLRILSGSVAFGIATSSWLLAFSVFLFLSLALVKRCSELVSLEQLGQQATHGRDYRVSDLAVLTPLGVASAMAAVVVFGLFITAAETQARYATPALLWCVALGLIYWLARLWIKTVRGEMHDDPVIYAIKDRGSRITIGTMGIVILVAHFVALDFIR